MGRPATASDDAPDDDAPRPDPASGEETERESIVRAIGPKVRRLRQDGGLSLQQLARRAEVSAAAIHKVERGDMVPTVTTLLKLAAALGRPVGHFVDGDGEPVPVAHLVRAGHRAAEPSLPGVSRSALSGPAERFAMGGTITVVEPGVEIVLEPHSGEDLVVLVEGALNVVVQDEQYTLGDGDSLHFPADRLVRCHNPGSVPARAIWVSSRGS
ncbi:MAG: XRE family transcriptional regulator [Pseudonocardia sp.]|nr:XRE family transcriptional regulator [Pseudonocardia sp.]